MTTDRATDANKALIRRWFAETDRGNDAIVDELCAPDYVDHSPPLPGMSVGSAGVRQANAALRAAFPDTVHLIEDQIAEGDKVVTRLRARATFTGEVLGIPPTGKPVEITGI
jgi:predicted ester cyclase